MIRLLFITDTNIGGRAGAEQHLKTLVSKLDPSKYSAHVLQLAENVPQKQGKIGVCTFSHLPTSRVMSLNGIRTIFTIIKIVRKNNYDCILSYFESSDIISVIVSYFTNSKVLISSRRDTGFLNSKKLKLLYKILNKRFNTIITASNAIRDIHITDGVDKKKVITVYNGVDLVRFSNVNKMKVRKELDIGNDEIILGMIANLSPVKNHRDVILCIKKFHDNNINLHLVLAGDGPLRDDLQSFTEELGLNRYIHFLGRRKDIPDILSGIDIFVLASKTEGLSNALLEAMAANKPVVATNVGGNPEVVINQETGYLIPSNNPDALYDAIHKLVISESKCKKFGETGHGRVSEIFSVESMIEKYESEIEKAITQQEKQPG